MRLAATYSRYSTDRQNPRSNADQEALWDERAPRDGLTIVARYRDSEKSSASLHGRDGVAQMLAAARAGRFAVLLVECLDRLSRDQADLPWLYKQLTFLGVAIVAYDEGPIDQMRVGIRGITGPMFLADVRNKIRRGLKGVLRDGRHPGGRAFGYRAVKGEPGRLAIAAAEAEIVRRIFDSYASGASPRDIAAALNRDKIPGPGGGIWNASTIAGSRARQNGILENALYAGRIVWNRQTFIKNPDTGKRVSRANPAAEWISRDAPALRIVGDDLWRRVQSRRGARQAQPHHRTRPQHLLSGLLRCGCCGSGYVVTGRDKRGRVLRCSRMKETGLCDNRRSIGAAALEAIVVRAIERDLAAPDMVALYVREYHRACQALKDGSGRRRAALERERSTNDAAIKRAVDLLLHGEPSRALRERLAELEAARERIAGELAAAAAPPIELHPNAADSYRKKIADLKTAIAAADPDSRAAAIAHLRELVDKIVIHPAGPYKAVAIEVHGRLAAFLAATQTGAIGRPESRGVLVAGMRNSHTPTLPPLVVRVIAPK